jgi:hypothetical protein
MPEIDANQKQREIFEADFKPVRAGGKDDQQLRALEFIAFRMGRIDDKLGRLIETLESLQKKA